MEPRKDRAARYWISTLREAIRRGDPFMTSAARRELRALGLDVRPARQS